MILESLTSSGHPIKGLMGATASEQEGPNPAGEDEGGSLEDVARQEREFLRSRLREELKREPTEEETDEYLQQHTESY